jgi:hypothetical protein
VNAVMKLFSSIEGVLLPSARTLLCGVHLRVKRTFVASSVRPRVADGGN